MAVTADRPIVIGAGRLLAAAGVTRGHHRFWHVARMEWIKLQTLRSTWWMTGITVAGAAAIGIAAGHGTKNASGDPTNNALAGLVPGLRS